MTEQQLLRNPEIEPTEEVIAEALGAGNSAYLMFIEGLTSENIEVSWRYYTDGKAWLGKGLYQWTGVRGGQKEVNTFWLSIWDGFFKITFYIPEKAREEVLRLPLDSETKTMIEESKQIGKLKFFPLVFDLRSEKFLNDVYTLVHFKKTVN